MEDLPFGIILQRVQYQLEKEGQRKYGIAAFHPSLDCPEVNVFQTL